jgi:hypothetical protein
MSRILFLEATMALLLTITVVAMWSGSWTWWPVFALLYGISLSLTALFLSRTPRWFWPINYRFTNSYDLGAVVFLSLLLPLGIFRLVDLRTPLAVGNVEYTLVLPFGIMLPVFLVMLPMLGLQAFSSSTAYLVVSKLMFRRSELRVQANILSSRFLISCVKSLNQVLGVLNLGVILVWALLSDVNATLSLIVVLQFVLPTFMLAMPLGRKMTRWQKELRDILLAVGSLLSFLAPAALPTAPSVLTILWLPKDWRSPLLASSTLCTLWGVSLARAYVLPPE